MINTYQTSLAPPPVPPRLSNSHPVLIPSSLPSQGHSKSLLRFLVGVVMLHLFLSIGGFIYLSYYGKLETFPSTDGKAAFSSSISTERELPSNRAMARMTIKQQSQTAGNSKSGYLQWTINQSFLRNINYYTNSWLTILETGDYYVYSRVSFSKSHSQRPLVNKVKLRKSEKEEDKDVMQAYCHMEDHSGSAPNLCTVMQGDVIPLEEGNQLSVWVEDLSLVDYEEGATAFGMYKL